MSEDTLEILCTEENRSNFKHNATGKVSVWSIFGVVILVYLLLAWLSQKFIYDSSLYYRSYSGTLPQQTIEGMLGFKSRFWWMGYLFTPIVLLLKFLFASICVSIGAVIAIIDIKFKDVFKAAMLAEVVFIIAQTIFLLSLYLNLEYVTLQNIAGYFPLSALSFIGVENVHAQWAIYPLQTANLFEVIYIIVLSWLLSKQWNKDIFESLNIVIPSYGLGLLLWIVLVVFLTLQIS